MNFFGSGLHLFCAVFVCIKISASEAAAIVCDDESAPAAVNGNPSHVDITIAATHDQPATTSTDVKQFLQTVQCTLEKAKPWVETIEQEAKRLEETAKRVGAGIINNLSNLMESLLQPNNASNAIESNNTTTSSIGSHAISLLSGILANVAASEESTPTATETAHNTNVSIAD